MTHFLSPVCNSFCSSLITSAPSPPLNLLGVTTRVSQPLFSFLFTRNSSWPSVLPSSYRICVFLCAPDSGPALSMQSRVVLVPPGIRTFPEFNCPLLEFPERGAIQAVNCISCTAEVNGNLDQLCGALLQSISKIFYFIIFLLILAPLIPQELSQFYCITCFDTGDLIFSTVLEVFFLPQEADRGKKTCFHAEQMCPDFLLFLFRFCHSLLS